METKPERILVVDDDLAIAELVKLNLCSQGYDVAIADCGEEAIRALRSGGFSLVILDIMMPGMDGFATLSAIRKITDIPVLLLSARGDEPDKVIGLGLGADDYITKPFSQGELIARVRAHLRRYSRKPAAPNAESVRRFSELSIDTAARRVSLRGVPVELTRTEYEILLFLSASPGRVYSFEQIYHRVWNEDYIGTPNTVMAHVKNLRGKLGETPRDRGFIRTVWGVGYKFSDD